MSKAGNNRKSSRSLTFTRSEVAFLVQAEVQSLKLYERHFACRIVQDLQEFVQEPAVFVGKNGILYAQYSNPEPETPVLTSSTRKRLCETEFDLWQV